MIYVRLSFFNDVYDDMFTLVTRYDQVLPSLLDAHAPSRQRTITVRPKAPWYTSDFASQKKLRRKLEHLWRRRKSQTHRKEYQKQCCVVKDLFFASKQTYCCENIKDNSYNQEFLFSIINKLLQLNNDLLYPSSTNNNAFANGFADFFAETISKIRSSILVAKSNLGVISLSPAQLVSLPSTKWIVVLFINC